ncbi:MAG: hypothetical protein AAB772_02295 [Patescibacteria group bacterium]
MIIFLYGPDAYRRRQKLNEILKIHRQKHSNLNSEIFDLADENEFLNFKTFLNSQSLFEDFKLAVVSGLYEVRPRKDLIKLIKEFLENKQAVIVILEIEEPPKDFIFLTAKPVQFQEFRELKGDYFKVFFKKEAALRALKFSASAEALLCGVYEPDSWGLVNDLDKIALADLSQPIELPVLRQVCDLETEDKVFDLTKALGAGRLKEKITSLEKLFLQKEAAPRVFNLLAVVAPAGLTTKLSDLDVSIKSGGLDYEEALLDLVI